MIFGLHFARFLLVLRIEKMFAPGQGEKELPQSDFGDLVILMLKMIDLTTKRMEIHAQNDGKGWKFMLKMMEKTDGNQACGIGFKTRG